MNTSALMQAWQQARSQWQTQPRVRAGLWLVLALALAQGLLLLLDRVDAQQAELQRLRGEEQRLLAVPSAQAWGERAGQAAQTVVAYTGMAWAEADVGLSEAALQDWLRTVSARLGLNVRELRVVRAQATAGASAGPGTTAVPSLPAGHVLLRARLVADLQRTPLLALLAECARSERSIVVERLVWRGAGQPPLVEIELRALAREAQPGDRP